MATQSFCTLYLVAHYPTIAPAALEDSLLVEQVGMDLMSMSSSKRFIAGCLIAWGTVTAFLLFGKLWLGELGSMPKSAAFFLWLFAVITWCAFGVVDQADHLAELLGEPLGTLVLTLSIVIIEVALISALTLTESV